MMVQLPLLLMVDAALAADIAAEAAHRGVEPEQMLSEMLADSWEWRKQDAGKPVTDIDIPFGKGMFDVGGVPMGDNGEIFPTPAQQPAPAGTTP